MLLSHPKKELYVCNSQHRGIIYVKSIHRVLLEVLVVGESCSLLLAL